MATFSLSVNEPINLKLSFKSFELKEDRLHISALSLSLSFKSFDLFHSPINSVTATSLTFTFQPFALRGTFRLPVGPFTLTLSPKPFEMRGPVQTGFDAIYSIPTRAFEATYANNV